ncbi:MAG: hypothetical protein ACYDBQ_04400 [Thermoplasmatota archaeon]
MSIFRAAVTTIPLDWRGELGTGLCPQACSATPLHAAVDASHAASSVRSPKALLWNLNVTLSWTGPAATPGGTLALDVFALHDCSTCPPLRFLHGVQGTSPVHLAFRDEAMRANETGLQFTVAEENGPGQAQIDQFQLSGDAVALSLGEKVA